MATSPLWLNHGSLGQACRSGGIADQRDLLSLSILNILLKKTGMVLFIVLAQAGSSLEKLIKIGSS